MIRLAFLLIAAQLVDARDPATRAHWRTLVGYGAYASDPRRFAELPDA